jgi:transposase
VGKVIRIGIDTSKSVFVLHGVDGKELPVLRKKLRRRDVAEFLAKLEPTRIGIEACGAAHYWGRTLAGLGHEVVVLPPQLVKPYVARNKNDQADAEAICETMSRPRMRFVPIKTAERQAAQMLLGLRDRLVRQRTQLTNAIRGYAAEFRWSPPGGSTRSIRCWRASPTIRRCRSRPRSCSRCTAGNMPSCWHGCARSRPS